jgi:hypothetical protein
MVRQKTGPKRKKTVPRKKGKRKNPIICSNADCKLRKQGCSGFEACPGYKER